MDPLFEALKTLNEAAYAATRIASRRQAGEAPELRKLCTLTDNLVDNHKHEKEQA